MFSSFSTEETTEAGPAHLGQGESCVSSLNSRTLPVPSLTGWRNSGPCTDCFSKMFNFDYKNSRGWVSVVVRHQCVSHQFIFQLPLTTISLNVKPCVFSSLILHQHQCCQAGYQVLGRWEKPQAYFASLELYVPATVWKSCSSSSTCQNLHKLLFHLPVTQQMLLDNFPVESGQFSDGWKSLFHV